MVKLCDVDRRMRRQDADARQGRMTIAEARMRGMLARRAAAPLLGRREQKRCDMGLFSDDARQIDFIDVLRAERDQD